MNSRKLTSSVDNADPQKMTRARFLGILQRTEKEKKVIEFNEKTEL